ncbi:hypothetical protein GWK47_017414 [Chionoecetes opilio]|uniref:Uncharacterized protein n=1 Tax=Chionoecetes opilio TaxID=41210 RepID=A0A8J5CH58_CHIOP|nr:hypothetical protein GWK47_017414 [Chionoecetes opilio]
MQLLQLARAAPQPTGQALHSTRAAHNIDPQGDCALREDGNITSFSFLPRYGRLWNTLVRQTDLHLTHSMHAFKSGEMAGCKRN